MKVNEILGRIHCTLFSKSKTVLSYKALLSSHLRAIHDGLVTTFDGDIMRLVREKRINPAILLQESRVFHRFDVKIIGGMWLKLYDKATGFS